MIGKTLSHYKIVEKLGSGGMGDVYVAEDSELGRQVALKVLPPEMAENEERRVRFKREARAIAALNHPNIVTVHSVEEDDGVHFMTMELVRGKTLAELQPKNGFALSKFLEISIPLADAIAAAHQEGITHRDLKPDNVMLGDDGRVKVLDFGLAKPKSGLVSDASGSDLPTQHKTEEGRILGTVSYMSPEQAEGKPVDERSDIFSLGIVFYEMLTGQRPFDGDTPASTLSAIIKVAPQSATELRPSTPRELARCLKRCLAKDPERRFQTCKDVRNELDEIKEALSTGELQASDAGVPARPRWSLPRVVGVGALLVMAGVVLGMLLQRPGSLSDSGVPRLTSPVQVTSAKGVESDPTWSPEGPTGRPTAITTGLGIESVSFLADGTKIAYSKGGRFANVWRMPILPDRAATWSDAEQLTFDQAYVEFVDLSPDGRRLVVNSNRTGFSDLWTLPSEGGEMQPLTNDAAPDWMPGWSPNGDDIVFYTGRSGNRDIFVLSIEGGPPRQLTTQPGGDIMPSWAPDGESIAYVSIREGNYDIWTMSVTGGEQNRLTDYAGQDNFPTWSPDGQWIAYTTSGGDSVPRIWRVPATGGTPEPMTERAGRLPRWAPDGESIYFYKQERPRNEIWAVSVDDRTERLIADLSGKPGLEGPFALATDGNYLYFTWEETLGDIWVMDVVWDE